MCCSASDVPGGILGAFHFPSLRICPVETWWAFRESSLTLWHPVYKGPSFWHVILHAVFAKHCVMNFTGVCSSQGGGDMVSQWAIFQPFECCQPLRMECGTSWLSGSMCDVQMRDRGFDPLAALSILRVSWRILCFRGELMLFGGGVENACALSLFKEIFCFIFFEGVANFFLGGGVFPLPLKQPPGNPDALTLCCLARHFAHTCTLSTQE